mmetsp:Transcript_13818/g.26345  ORF Transcript_13818/g.26345 Transcript_13818/m.26345 type:complete len:172 (+) Transcript_13818:58-573(+)
MAPKAKKPKRTNKPSPLDRMKEAFELVDLDTNQEVTKTEFLNAMKGIGIDKSIAEGLFNRFDPDGNGVLDREEFFAYCAKGSGEVRSLIRKGVPESDDAVDKVVEIFRAWDRDGDGTISKDELERVLIVLNPSFTKKDLTNIMKAADKNNDGVIDYEEFADWLQDCKMIKR